MSHFTTALTQSLQQQQQQQQSTSSLSTTPRKFPAIIGLNVGGTIYSTTLTTLTQDPESMLARMFSGNIGLTQDANGNYFIDRDGTHFRYILNYLRDGTLNYYPPEIREELLAEAKYYQIQSLIAHLENEPKRKSEAERLEKMAVDWAKEYKAREIKQLKEFILTEFERQAATGTLQIKVSIYSNREPDIYKLGCDDAVRNVVFKELNEMGFKILNFKTTTTGSVLGPFHLIETSILQLQQDVTDKLEMLLHLLQEMTFEDVKQGVKVKGLRSRFM
jgi:hypothetical protein